MKEQGGARRGRGISVGRGAVVWVALVRLAFYLFISFSESYGFPMA